MLNLLASYVFLMFLCDVYCGSEISQKPSEAVPPDDERIRVSKHCAELRFKFNFNSAKAVTSYVHMFGMYVCVCGIEVLSYCVACYTARATRLTPRLHESTTTCDIPHSVTKRLSGLTGGVYVGAHEPLTY